MRFCKFCLDLCFVVVLVAVAAAAASRMGSKLTMWDAHSIRPLLTTDLKKRRLSGRDQILPGGEHIIDGVPFGRPRLRAPRGRPPVAIAPRKRRRLLDNQEYHPGGEDDFPDDNLADDNFSDLDRQLRDSDRRQQLLLTRHGENPSRLTRHVRFAPRIIPGSEEAFDDELSSVEEYSEQDGDEDMVEPDSQELADEAADLRREIAEEEDRRSIIKSRSRSATMAADYPKRPSGLNANALGPGGDGQDANETPPAQDSHPDLALFDKVVAVRAAFNVSHKDAVKLLLKHNKDVSMVWRALERSLKPRQGLAETMVLATQLELPREVQIISSPATSPAHATGDISRIDDDEQAESPSSDEDDSSDESDEGYDAHEHDPGATESDNEGASDTSSEYVSARPSPPPDDAVGDSASSSVDSSSDDEHEQIPTKSPKVQPKQAMTQSKSARASEAQQNDSSDSSDASDSSSEEEAPVALRMKDRRTKKCVSSSSDDDSISSDASSDSSSDSDSDSRSESDSESETDLVKIVPTVQSESLSKAKLHEKSQTEPQRAMPRQNAPVPPGQGLTRTQRRNQRRRLETRAKKAAQQSLNKSQKTQDVPASEADLEAKKRALLQELTTESNPFEEGLSQTVDDAQMADGDQSAWKSKISYRAVECVQEGVELSEPPFPFVQRWDPQQCWESRPSQRRGKRKSRADTQFYNDSSSHSSKKRKFGQPVDEYYYHEDTTTLQANPEDIELDYDDATFNPDEDPMANGFTGHSSRHTDEQAADDLPSLPADISLLPILDVVDLKLGMIIAWKQLLCTEATHWQPQLSGYMTASVTKTREGDANFQVRLARRDRDIDRNVKKYDEETGQRVYGKFEAPDSDEDGDDDASEEEDDGIREVCFGEMIEPRIVQQATEVSGVGSNSEVLAEKGSAKSDAPDFAAPQLPDLGFEVADSQPKQGSHDEDSSGKRAESHGPSGTLRKDQVTEQGQESMQSKTIDADVMVEESLIPETLHHEASLTAEDLSMTEDRRGEISELINQGGFRQEVPSSIEQSAFLRFGQGSPSRQLEEEYASSVLLSNRKDTSRRSSSSGAPSEYDTRAPMQYEVKRSDCDSAQPPAKSSLNSFKSPSQQNVSHAAATVEVDTFHSAPQTPSIQQIRSDRTGEEESTRLTTPSGQDSTGKVEYPKLNVSQTTQTSNLSGRRQLDPNFVTHSEDLGISFHDDDTALDGGSTDFHQLERERTPMQQVYNDQSQIASVSDMLSNLTQPDSQPLSRPQSAASDGSDQSFPDIKILSSQVATTKVNDFTGTKTESRASDDALAGEDLPPQPLCFPQEAEIRSPLSPVSGSPLAVPSTPSAKNERNGINGGNARSNSVSFSDSISPPALSRPRQTRASSRSQTTSRGKSLAPARSTSSHKPSNKNPSIKGSKGKTDGSSSIIPKGSQVVDLVGSSVEPTRSPEPEPEPEYSEMHADDSVVEDYLSNCSKTRKALATRRTSRAGPRERRASVPMGEKEETIGPGWVGGSQGPSRKASGRSGGRATSTGAF